MDQVTFATWLGSIAAVAALGLTIWIAVRRSDLRKSQIELVVGLRGWIDAPRPRPLRGGVSEYFFYFSSQGAAVLDYVPLFIGVRNKPTNRAVSDVVVELTYPTRTVVSNREVVGALKKYGHLINEPPGVSEDTAARMVQSRSISAGREISVVRTEIGLVRPGDTFSFTEMLRAADGNAERKSDERFSDSAYANVEKLLLDIPDIRDHITVQVAMYSAEAPKRSITVRLAVLGIRSVDDAPRVAKAYATANWFGDLIPAGFYFFLNPFRKSAKLTYSASCELWQLEPEAKLMRDENRTKRIMMLDPEPHDGNLMRMDMPRYDATAMPSWVDSRKKALRWLGVIALSTRA